MASMQCDICGERLTMDISGEFAVCDYCGIRHPKARLMKKVSGLTQNSRESKEQYEGVAFASTPEPAVTMESVSDNAYQPEVFPEPEPMCQVYSEPIFVSRASSQSGAMDAEVNNMPSVDENTNIESNTSSMSAVEIAEFEKKNTRIEELKVELKEFEEIYEANKNKFLGEGLKRKNYSETKIKEIKEKLDELGA